MNIPDETIKAIILDSVQQTHSDYEYRLVTAWLEALLQPGRSIPDEVRGTISTALSCLPDWISFHQGSERDTELAMLSETTKCIKAQAWLDSLDAQPTAPEPTGMYIGGAMMKKHRLVLQLSDEEIDTLRKEALLNLRRPADHARYLLQVMLGLASGEERRLLNDES